MMEEIKSTYPLRYGFTLFWPWQHVLQLSWVLVEPLEAQGL